MTASRATLLFASALLGWTTHGCGRTSLRVPGAQDASGTLTATSTVTSTGGAGPFPATSQPAINGTCPAGLTACGRRAAIRCYDLTRSPEDCGQCGNACAPGIACESSRCQQHQCKGALTFNALPGITTFQSGDDSYESLAYYLPVLGDFDGDGTLDFVGQPGIFAPMGLLLGKGDGTFQAHAIASAFAYTWSAAAADLNGDGRLDLASITGTINGNDAAVTVRLGNGDPATLLEPATTYPTPSSPGSLLLADLDNDGNVDLVAAETKRLTLWRGAADGRLAEPVDIPVGSSSLPGSSADFLIAADWNRDGVPDLVFGTSTLRMLLGRGDGTFDNEIACGLALDGSPSGNVLADFDHDQKIDMLAGGKVFLGMNGCNFSTLVSIPSWNYGGLAALNGVADLNGDGNPDIVTGSSTMTGDEQISVLLGDGHGGFSHALDFPSFGGQPGGAFLVGDLNHDTKLDIIVTRPDGWRVLLNTCP